MFWKLLKFFDKAIWPALVLALFFCVMVATGHCKDKPVVRFTASPRLSNWDMANGNTITLRLVVENADEDLWCPQIIWEYPNDTTAIEEQDCEPFAEADPKEVAYQSWTKHVTVGPGEFKFVVRLVHNGKTIRVLNAVVQVMGG